MLNATVKIIIAGLLLWAIYVQVFARENLSDLGAAFRGHFRFPGLFWLLACMVLMPVNLSLEALKWRRLARNFSAPGFGETLKSVLAGLTFAIFTPNRVGEYGGRVLFVEEGQGWKALLATLVGNISQLLVLLTFGIVAALFFSNSYLSLAPYLFTGLSVVAAGLLLLLYAAYFNIDQLAMYVKRLPGIGRFRSYLRHFSVLRHYKGRDLGVALLFAFLRYATYSTQYYLLLKFYGIGAGWPLAMAGIATIFMVQASIPLPPVLGLMVRGEVALFIWGRFSSSAVDILAATFTLFVINLVVPALLGLYFIMRLNFARRLGIERPRPQEELPL